MNGVPTMSFLEKYQIVSMLTASETNTYRAQEILTGRPVLVHQFLRGQTSPHQPDLISLVYANLPGTGTPGTEHFLDSGEDGDQVFIVTSDVPDCLDLRRWLLFIAASQAPPTPELKPAPAVKPPDKRLRGQIPSGFQVVFQSRKQAPHAVEAGPTVVLPPPGPTETARHGEFPPEASGLNKGDVEAPPRQSLVTPGPPPGIPPPLSTEKTGPGEFTEMFSGMGNGPATGQPLPPSPPASVKPPTAAPSKPNLESGGPGEFTQMFSAMGKGQVDQPTAPSPTPPLAPRGPSQPPAQKSTPGTFTQMFNIPSQGMPEPPAAPTPSPRVTKPFATPVPSAQNTPGEFTALFHSPVQTTSKREPPRSGPNQAPATPTPGSGARGPSQEHKSFPPSQSDSDDPGTFTRMFKTAELKGGARSPVPGSPGQPSAPPSSVSKKEPGELTLLMQGYKPPAAMPTAPALNTPQPPSPPPAADPGKRAPGEFTMLFRQPPQPTVSGPPAAPPPPAVRAAPPPPQPQAPGEYTSIFEAPRTSPEPPQGASKAAAPAGHGYPAVPAAPPQAPTMPQPPQYQPPPSPAAPTIPQMQPMAIPPPAVPQPSPAAGAKKPPMFWVMLIVLGCLFLAAVVLVIFFALKH